LLDTTSYARR